jgi:hypothetical protein
MTWEEQATKYTQVENWRQQGYIDPDYISFAQCAVFCFLSTKRLEELPMSPRPHHTYFGLANLPMRLYRASQSKVFWPLHNWFDRLFLEITGKELRGRIAEEDRQERGPYGRRKRKLVNEVDRKSKIRDPKRIEDGKIEKEGPIFRFF